MEKQINYVKISELDKVPMNETLSTVKLNCAGDGKNYHAVMGELFSYISTYFVAPAVEEVTATTKELENKITTLEESIAALEPKTV